MSIIQEALKKAQATSGSADKVMERYDTIIRTGKIAKTPDRKSVEKKYIRFVVYAVIAFILLSVLAARYLSMPQPRQLPAAKPIPMPKEKVSHPASVVQPEKTLPAVELPEKPVVPPQPVVQEQPAVRERYVPQQQALYRPQPEVQKDDFKLSGIMHLEDGPRAIINNLTVVEGDYVGDAAVMKINNNSVVLKRGDSEITLHLK